MQETTTPTRLSAYRDGYSFVYFEGDNGFSDEDYTAGVRIEAGRRIDSEGFAYGVIQYLNAFSGPSVDWQGMVGAQYGFNMYTPTDIAWPALLPGDRPYAGWMYVGATLRLVLENL
ncbi:MAG: lipid A-modifier LpxR family protein, partial [Myxococcota bacterium]